MEYKLYERAEAIRGQVSDLANDIEKFLLTKPEKKMFFSENNRGFVEVYDKNGGYASRIFGVKADMSGGISILVNSRENEDSAFKLVGGGIWISALYETTDMMETVLALADLIDYEG